MIHAIVPLTRCGDITFHANGRIDITAHVTRLLDLRPGDVVGIATDDGCPAEHYLYVARRAADLLGRHACACQPAKGNGRYLRVHNKLLAQQMLNVCHVSPMSGDCHAPHLTLFVGEAVTLPGLGLALPLITARYQQPEFINPDN